MSTRPNFNHAAAVLIALVMLAGSPARTEDLAATPIDDSELDQIRGGFMVEGVEFNFGAVLKTTVDGQLALQTNVTWTPTGAQTTVVLGPNATQGAGAVNGTVKGLNLQGLTPDQVAVLNNGATAIIQKVTGGAVQNIVLNTASDQNISQSTEVHLDLPGFAQTQQLFQQNVAVFRLMQATQSGLTPTIGH
jgi:hypothetical protein